MAIMAYESKSRMKKKLLLIQLGSGISFGFLCIYFIKLTGPNSVHFQFSVWPSKSPINAIYGISGGKKRQREQQKRKNPNELFIWQK